MVSKTALVSEVASYPAISLKKIRDYFIYSTCKRYFEDKILNTKYQKCSKHNHNLLTLHCGLKKVCDVPLGPQENQDVPVRSGWWNELQQFKGHFGTQKKKSMIQLRSKHETAVLIRVYFHEGLPAACYNFLSQVFTHLSHFSKTQLICPSFSWQSSSWVL